MTEKQIKLLEKFDELLKDLLSKEKIHAASNGNALERYKLSLPSLEALDKLGRFFGDFLFSLPEETRAALYKEFQDNYIIAKGTPDFNFLQSNKDRLNKAFDEYKKSRKIESTYDSMKDEEKNVIFEEFKQNHIYGKGKKLLDATAPKGIVPDRYPTQESLKYYLFYHCPVELLKNGEARKMLEKAVQLVDDKTAENHINEIDSFKSHYVHNVKVYPLRHVVDELKEKNNSEIADEEERKALNEELELIANTVVTSTNTYSRTNGESYDNAFRAGADAILDQSNEKALAMEENKHLNQYFDVYESGNYGGIRPINNKHLGNPDLINIFTDEKIKMVIPKDIQAALKKVMTYMRENGMLNDNASTSDSPTKVYGYQNIYDAHKNLVKVIETKDLNAIKEARMKYQSEVEKMRGLYKLIKEELNPVPEKMLGNITSYRVEELPNEFKNDIICNVFVNGLYNLNATLSQSKVTLDEMLENPNKAFFKMLMGSAETNMANSVMGKMKNSDAIQLMTCGKPTGSFSGMGLGRNMEFLQALTYGTDVYDKNTLGTMLIQSYALYIAGNLTNGVSLTTKDYLNTKASETIANMLLVNPEDRDFNKIRAEGSYNIALTEKIEAFDTMEYINSHNIDSKAFIGRIKDTISELNQYRINLLKRTDKPANSVAFDDLKASTIRDAVYGAQIAAYKYLLAHPVPIDAFLDDDKLNENERTDKADMKKVFDELKKMAEDPISAFADSISQEIKDSLAKYNSPLTDIMTKGAKLNAARKEVRKAEKEYEKKMADATKKYNALSEKVKSSGEVSDTVKNDFKEAEKDLTKFKNEELKRLKQAFEDGKIPKSYYDQRKLDVENGTHKNTVPFGADEYVAMARAEARRAEQEYAKSTEELTKTLNALSAQIDSNEKAKSELDKVRSELNKLKNSELERLDKAYTDGKLTKTYYEQRKLDVENGNHKNTVPFGEEDAPTFSKFKEKYKDELKRKELTTNDVRIFYDRMMENLRFEDEKFKLVAMGHEPKPTLYKFEGISIKNTTYKTYTNDEPEANKDSKKMKFEVPEAKEKDTEAKSPEIIESKERYFEKNFN